MAGGVGRSEWDSVRGWAFTVCHKAKAHASDAAALNKYLPTRLCSRLYAVCDPPASHITILHGRGQLASKCSKAKRIFPPCVRTVSRRSCTTVLRGQQALFARLRVYSSYDHVKHWPSVSQPLLSLYRTHQQRIPQAAQSTLQHTATTYLPQQLV